MAENKDNNITSVMEALVKGAESVFTTKTVVGEATKIDDTIIIPLVDVSFGIGAGASCGAGKDSRKNGGMGGMSGKMSPSAVLLIKNGQTRLVNIKNQDSASKISANTTPKKRYRKHSIKNIPIAVQNIANATSRIINASIPAKYLILFSLCTGWRSLIKNLRKHQRLSPFAVRLPA